MYQKFTKDLGIDVLIPGSTLNVQSVEMQLGIGFPMVHGRASGSRLQLSSDHRTNKRLVFM